MTKEDSRQEVELVIPVTLHISRTVTSTCGSEDEVRERIREFQEVLVSQGAKGVNTSPDVDVADVEGDYSFALELNEDQIEKFEE